MFCLHQLNTFTLESQNQQLIALSHGERWSLVSGQCSNLRFRRSLSEVVRVACVRVCKREYMRFIFDFVRRHHDLSQ